MGQFVSPGERLKIVLLTIISAFLLQPLSSMNAKADDQSKEVAWFVNLLQTNNGKAFCIPPKTILKDISSTFFNYRRSRNMPDNFTGPQAIQILAQIYPCAGGNNLDDVEISKLAGKNIDVMPTGEYATINIKPAAATMQKLRSTSGHENDNLMMEIQKKSGNYMPPVLFALANLLYRQGNKVDAIFWFNAGRIRAIFDAERCTDVTARSAVSALVQQTPKELIKAQFDDMVLLRNIIDRVISWDESTPHNYEYRWINLHGLSAINSGLGMDRKSTGPLTVANDKWDAMARNNRDDYRKHINQAIETVAKSRNQ